MKIPRGVGLVEILIGIFCFLIAVLPLVRLFSLNIESARVLHTKAITLSAAREILQQSVIEHPMLIPPGSYVIDAGTASFTFPGAPRLQPFVLTALSPGFRRLIMVNRLGTQTTRISVRVEHDQVSRANVELSRTITGDAGGRP